MSTRLISKKIFVKLKVRKYFIQEKGRLASRNILFYIQQRCMHFWTYKFESLHIKLINTIMIKIIIKQYLIIYSGFYMSSWEILLMMESIFYVLSLFLFMQKPYQLHLLTLAIAIVVQLSIFTILTVSLFGCKPYGKLSKLQYLREGKFFAQLLFWVQHTLFREPQLSFHLIILTIQSIF